jgi:hypothetical protein
VTPRTRSTAPSPPPRSPGAIVRRRL